MERFADALEDGKRRDKPASSECIAPIDILFKKALTKEADRVTLD